MKVVSLDYAIGLIESQIAQQEHSYRRAIIEGRGYAEVMSHAAILQLQGTLFWLKLKSFEINTVETTEKDIA